MIKRLGPSFYEQALVQRRGKANPVKDGCFKS